MNWCDEHYAKLYTRDTLTWLSWPWQARCLAPLLLRKVDGAGIIETGGLEPAAAIAMQLMIPIEVVEPGLVAMLSDGTLETVSGGILWPAYVEAQEARKSEAQKKRDQRSKARDQRRQTPPVPRVSPAVPHVESRGQGRDKIESKTAEITQVPEMLETHVPRVSPAVPRVSPSSPAQPSPAQPVPFVVRATEETEQTEETNSLPPPPEPEPDVEEAPTKKKSQRAGWQVELYQLYVEARQCAIIELAPETDEFGPVIPEPEPIDYAFVASAITRIVGDHPPEERRARWLELVDWWTRQPWAASPRATEKYPNPTRFPFRLFASTKTLEQARREMAAEYPAGVAS